MYVFGSRNIRGISVERFKKIIYEGFVGFYIVTRNTYVLCCKNKRGKKSPAAHENSTLCYMEHTILFFICLLTEIETHFGCCYCCPTFRKRITIKFCRLALFSMKTESHKKLESKRLVDSLMKGK